MLKYLLLFAGGLLFSLLLTPLVRKLAIFLGAVDMPNARKVHQRPIPRMGGLAVFAAFHVTVLLGLYVLPLGHYPAPLINDQWWKGFLPASAILVGLGVCDDIRSLGARFKFLIQAMAALVAIRFGFVIDHVTLPWGTAIEFGLLSLPVTLLWIVGVTNAFNLIDGLDGLAAGIGVLSSLTLAAIALLNQQVELALLCSVLAGALAGFLRYNFHPASIFMGDAGSLFVGFTLAVLSIKTSHKSSAAVSVLIPILAFGLPIMDTLLAMARRFLRAMHVIEKTRGSMYRLIFRGGQSMFEADRDHIHHRLMQLGITHKNCVIVLYGICTTLGGIAFLLASVRNLNVGLILLAMGVATVFAVQKLRYQELQWLRNGTLLPLSKLPLLGYRMFQILIDLALISLAYYVTYWIHFEGRFEGPVKICFIETLPVVLLTKVLVFYFTGFYRIKWEHAGLPDLLRGMRSTLLGCLVAGGVLSCLPLKHCPRAVLIMDFYVMSSLLLGIRFSVRLLAYYARSNPEHKRKVLIYGADRNGSLLMHELLTNQKLSLTPVGFIDDDPGKQQKVFHGYPILSSFQVLGEKMRSLGAEELILATPDINSERLRDILECCRHGGITTRRFQVSLEEVPQACLPRRPALRRRQV